MFIWKKPSDPPPLNSGKLELFQSGRFWQILADSGNPDPAKPVFSKNKMSPSKQISSKVSLFSSFFKKTYFFYFFLILSQVLRCKTQIRIFWKIRFPIERDTQISKKLKKTGFLWQILGGFNELYFLKKKLWQSNIALKEKFKISSFLCFSTFFKICDW